MFINGKGVENYYLLGKWKIQTKVCVDKFNVWQRRIWIEIFKKKPGQGFTFSVDCHTKYSENVWEEYK